MGGERPLAAGAKTVAVDLKQDVVAGSNERSRYLVPGRRTAVLYRYWAKSGPFWKQILSDPVEALQRLVC